MLGGVASAAGLQLAGTRACRWPATQLGLKTLDVTLLGRVSALLSGMAPQVPQIAGFRWVRSRFSLVNFHELLLIASQPWPLAAVALPGIGARVIVTVVGVRIGYGRGTPDSHRATSGIRDSLRPGAVKRWMSAR